MNDILVELSKPVWWVSVVVAGIVINLLSAYIKNSLDTLFSGMSSWWRRRSVARQAEWTRKVEALRSSEKARRITEVSEFRKRLQSVHLLLLAIIPLLLSTVLNTSGAQISPVLGLVVLAISATIFFVSFVAFRESAELANLLLEAESEN